MEDFGTVSMPRNPLIMDLMLRVSKVERIGSGINRIKDAMRGYGLDVKFESTSFFNVKFKRPATPPITPLINLTQLEEEILKLIKRDNKITKISLSNKLNIGEDTVKEYLSKLRKKGILKRIGTKGGHWEILI